MFADAVFAIALTLIVVGIEVPELPESATNDELLDQLGDLVPAFVSFFVSFAVIGGYWIAHHRFVNTLDEVDTPFMWAHLMYLSVIGFLPFPSALFGRFDENAVAFTMFALTLAAASAMETVLVWRAQRAKLARVPISEQAFRWVVVSSISPVVLFAVSVPVAFFVAPWVGIVIWFLNVPIGAFLNRRAPADLRPA